MAVKANRLRNGFFSLQEIIQGGHSIFLLFGEVDAVKRQFANRPRDSKARQKKLNLVGGKPEKCAKAPGKARGKREIFSSSYEKYVLRRSCVGAFGKIETHSFRTSGKVREKMGEDPFRKGRGGV